MATQKKTRKVTQGEIRFKERTRQRIIDSTGEIALKEGFMNLSVTKVAKLAGVERVKKQPYHARDFFIQNPIYTI